MPYLTLDEINANADNAPIGYEIHYRNRIIRDNLLIALNALDTEKTIKQNKIKAEYQDYIIKLIDPYNQQHVSQALPNLVEKSTNLNYWADWDCRTPFNGKNWGKKYHRSYLQENAETFMNEILDSLGYLNTNIF